MPVFDEEFMKNLVIKLIELQAAFKNNIPLFILIGLLLIVAIIIQQVFLSILNGVI